MSVRGTISQLSTTATINGHSLNVPQLSMLTTLGEGKFARKVGVADKEPGKRGRAATIWELESSDVLQMGSVGSTIGD